MTIFSDLIISFIKSGVAVAAAITTMVILNENGKVESKVQLHKGERQLCTECSISGEKRAIE